MSPWRRRRAADRVGSDGADDLVVVQARLPRPVGGLGRRNPGSSPAGCGGGRRGRTPDPPRHGRTRPWAARPDRRRGHRPGSTRPAAIRCWRPRRCRTRRPARRSAAPVPALTWLRGREVGSRQPLARLGAAHQHDPQRLAVPAGRPPLDQVEDRPDRGVADRGVGEVLRRTGLPEQQVLDLGVDQQAAREVVLERGRDRPREARCRSRMVERSTVAIYFPTMRAAVGRRVRMGAVPEESTLPSLASGPGVRGHRPEPARPRPAAAAGRAHAGGSAASSWRRAATSTSAGRRPTPTTLSRPI